MTAETAEATEQAAAAKESFADMLDTFLDDTPRFEGGVVKGTILAIENDAALIDVGLKVEGRVPLKEFAAPGQAAEVKVGDEVEVYIERFETARGEASLSRERAAVGGPGRSWKRPTGWRSVQAHLSRVKAALRRSRRRPVRFCRGQVIPRCATCVSATTPFQILQDGTAAGNIVVFRVPCWRTPGPSSATS